MLLHVVLALVSPVLGKENDPSSLPASLPVTLCSGGAQGLSLGHPTLTPGLQKCHNGPVTLLTVATLQGLVAAELVPLRGQ